MSVAAYSVAVRNYLRTNLDDFYGSDTTARTNNCKVMLDEHPTAASGQEFIAIYGSTHVGTTYPQALEEEIGLVIAVSRKIAFIPPDYRGEKGYLDVHALTIEDDDEETQFLDAWKSTEARCREIVKLIAGGDRYRIMVAANALLSTGNQFTEPLRWQRSDAAPKQVGADHFYSYYEPIQDSDPTFGLCQKIYFTGAIRFQPLSKLDITGP